MMNYPNTTAPTYPATAGYPLSYGAPASYAPYPQQAPQYMPQQSRQPHSGLNWCQGIEGAKGFYVQPGTSELIMDSEGPIFYIKSVDASGIPAPLRVFHYSEEIAQQPQAAQSDYVTRQELPQLVAQAIAAMQQQGGNNDA